MISDEGKRLVRKNSRLLEALNKTLKDNSSDKLTAMAIQCFESLIRSNATSKEKMLKLSASASAFHLRPY